MPKLTWRREISEKVVYLTFDDGPHPTITPWVINELDKIGAKATFFLVGDNADMYTDVLNALKLNGHSIGNHTQNHVKGWKKSKSEYLKNIEKGQSKLGEKRFFRPPFGQINVRAMNEILACYEVIMWDVLTKDYLKSLDHRRTLRRIQKATVPGSVIVFHDSEKAEKNLRALLPPYLKFLKKEGYRMEVL